MTWTSVGSVDVGPQDREVLVGQFSMQPDEDTIWFRVTQTSPADVWKYSYGLLTWRTSFGQELGTKKVYGDTDSEVFKLGVGLPPLERTGSVYFSPRSYNRRWIAIDNPPIWSLSFEAQSGASAGVGPAPEFSSTLVTLAKATGEALDFVIADGFARLASSSFLTND